MVTSKINTQLLDINQVLEKLKISRKTLYTLRKDGKINAVLVGDCVRFTEDEVIRFINESIETQNAGE